jgi:hypothetical protein
VECQEYDLLRAVMMVVILQAFSRTLLRLDFSVHLPAADVLVRLPASRLLRYAAAVSAGGSP